MSYNNNKEVDAEPSMKSILSDLSNISNILFKRFTQDLKDLEMLNRLIASLSTVDPLSDLLSKIEQITIPEEDVGEKGVKGGEEVIDVSNSNVVDPDSLLENDDEILQRRINFHKEKGTYEDKEDHYSKGVQMITPLHKLSNKEQENLYKRIFNNAKTNITNVTNMTKDDIGYFEKVSEEADRLLDVWMQINKR